MNMEDKLELKHAAPYLPYGVTATKEDWGKTFKMDIDGTTLNCVGIDYVLHKQAKLLLHPLSRLTQEDCTQIAELIYHIDVTWRDIQSLFTHKRFRVLDQPWAVVEYLIKKHYDVFSLIPQGLALPIEPQPIKTK